jgi:hypothetical protein
MATVKNKEHDKASRFVVEFVDSIRCPSSCSLGTKSHPSAFSPVPPRNNTLPKHGKGEVTYSPVPDMERNGSVPRLRDFDGQSQISENCVNEQQNIHFVEELVKMHLDEILFLKNMNLGTDYEFEIETLDMMLHYSIDCQEQGSCS